MSEVVFNEDDEERCLPGVSKLFIHATAPPTGRAVVTIPYAILSDHALRIYPGCICHPLSYALKSDVRGFSVRTVTQLPEPVHA